jgi:hypothetical protein
VLPNWVVAEVDELGAWKFWTFRTVFQVPLLDAALVDVAAFMMRTGGAFSAVAVASVTILVTDIVNAGAAV